MACKVLLISRGSGFMTDALNSNLKRNGFEIVVSEPDIKCIEAVKEDIDLILVLVGDFVYDAVDALVYLADFSRDWEKPICLIGYEDEFAEIKKYIPETYIKKEFKRPLDARYISEQLNDLAAVAEEKKRGKHILMVDDDTTFLKMLQGWLSDKYRVTAVKSGIQAITYMANHKPDLILLDYDMPITTGPQVMEMIRSEYNYQDIPIIFLTGKSDRQSILNVMRLKPQGYLLKAMSKDDIVAAIDEYFENNKWNDLLQ